MNKSFHYLLPSLILIIPVMLVATAIAGVQDQYEPDNSVTQYEYSHIAYGETQTRSIVPANDVDIVRFSLAQPSNITIETNGTYPDDTRLWLLDAYGNELEVFRQVLQKW